MKKINALMLGIALAFGISTTSCNKNDTPTPEGGEKQVQVKVDLGTNNRANDLTDLIADQTALEATQLDIYITDGQKVLRSVRIDQTANAAEWAALTTGNGLKFLQITSKATNVIVIANSQKALVLKDGAVSTISDDIALSMATKQVLGGSANLTPTTAEPAPGTLAPGETGPAVDGTPVSTAEVIVRPIISRFQIVGVEFKKKVWSNQTIAYDNATPAQLENDANYTVEPDTDAKLVGILFNRFFDNSVLTTGVAGASANLLETLTYAGSLVVSGGNTADYATTSWSIKNKDVTEYASYVAQEYVGVTNMFAGADNDLGAIGDNKVASFNFFAKDLKTTPAADKNTPKIHMVISKKAKDGSYKLLFANVVGYKKADGSADIDFVNGKLYNMNFTDKKIGTVDPTGAIITENEKPDEDDNVNPDISDVDINIVAKVTVAKWAAENVKPVFE